MGEQRAAIVCHDCNGTGAENGVTGKGVVCLTCGGRGTVEPSVTTSTRKNLGWGVCCVAIPLCFFGGLSMVPWTVFLSGFLAVVGGVLMGAFHRGVDNGS